MALVLRIPDGFLVKLLIGETQTQQALESSEKIHDFEKYFQLQ